MKAIAVIAGDIHYSLPTLYLADASTRMAIETANKLNVPFIANGDTTDTKANLRAECVNAMIETFKMAKTKPYINIGNHCKTNEKSGPAEHALHFLQPYANVIETPTYIKALGLYIIPYQNDIGTFKSALDKIPKDSIVIAHQGVMGSNLGDYVQDQTAIPKIWLSKYRIILSHYHARQDIDCMPGIASYIGNPYTLTYGEANDPEKGYQILYNDGSLEFVPTNLRRHVIIEMRSDGKAIPYNYTKDDLVWVKVYDTKANLAILNKATVGKMLNLDSFKFEQICTEEVQTEKADLSLKSDKLLDSIIDSLSDVSDDRKNTLKSTWRQLCD
jgi:hypothetical protein